MLKYKDIDITINGKYTEGIKRCVQVVIPAFSEDILNDIINGFKKSDNEGAEEAAIKRIMPDSFTYDSGTSLADTCKEYFLGIDLGEFNGKLEQLDKHRTTMYNFCYHSEEIEKVYNKDISRLNSSTTVIENLVKKATAENPNGTGNKLRPEEESAMYVQEAKKNKNNQQQQAQQNAQQQTQNQQQQTQQGNQQQQNNQQQQQTQNQQNGNDQDNKNPGGSSGGVTASVNTNAIKVSNSMDKNATLSDEEKEKLQQGMTNTGLSQDDLYTAVQKWTDTCRTVITAKMTAQEQIAKGFMEIFRTHVRSYIGQKDENADFKKLKQGETYQKPNTNANAEKANDQQQQNP